MNVDELATRAKAGDKQAQGELIAEMQRYIRKTAHQMAVGLPAEDCEQELAIAILGLTKTWNPEGGASFFTYAYTYAPKKAFRMIARYSCPVSLPVVSDIKKAPNRAYINRFDNESEQDAEDRAMFESGHLHVDTQQQAVEHSEVRRLVYEALGAMHGTCLWHWACGESLELCAAILGVSRERARQVIKKSLVVLRERYGTQEA